ncbi:MAG: hypothetical protein IAA16_05370 [Candidatus Treponema excrementipullorum]|uniref:DUF1566 domain-containing protein n=1 Tax=Candidatus Treponema excrementipullorum TaxID=2838768 RepID=A0A9E2L2F7_9SPIR|nr:hypothetical protein [Candidatus Treponema excrementipullorum]
MKKQVMVLVLCLVSLVLVFTGCKKIEEPLSISPKVGEIVLNDGSRVPFSRNMALTPEQKEKAVAIIVMARREGNSIFEVALGLHQDKDKSWGDDTISIPEIECWSTEGSKVSAARDTKITGDLFGHDNYEEIKKVDKNINSNDYGIFERAEKYSEISGVNITDKFTTGWYVPSLAELCELFKVKNAVNIALEALGKAQLRDLYWSSSQFPGSEGKEAWLVNFNDGKLMNASKKASGITSGTDSKEEIKAIYFVSIPR